MTLEEYIKRGKFHDVRIISSYHNHNYLCRHAFGVVKDYVEGAKEKGLEIIGISDHGPLDLFETKPRMTNEEFYEDYLPQFKKANHFGVEVKKGLELEYFPEFIDKYKEYRKYVDYMLLGQHIFRVNGIMKSVHFSSINDEDIKIYGEEVKKAISTHLFDAVAHPDVIFHNVEKVSRVGREVLEDIVKCAIENNILLEVNVSGIRKTPIGNTKYRYPRQEYLDILKKYNAKIIVSDDAHRVSEINDDVTKAVYSYLEDEGFNIVYKI